MDLFQELGLKAPTATFDDTNESLWLSSMDRWGDLKVNSRNAHRLKVETRYYFEPKVRRRLRYQAAILAD